MITVYDEATLAGLVQSLLSGPAAGKCLTFYNMYGLTPEERLDRAGATIRAAAEIAKSRERRNRA